MNREDYEDAVGDLLTLHSKEPGVEMDKVWDSLLAHDADQRAIIAAWEEAMDTRELLLEQLDSKIEILEGSEASLLTLCDLSLGILNQYLSGHADPHINKVAMHLAEAVQKADR